MLRNGRLLHLQSIHNLPHRPFLQRQVVEYLSPPRLRHSIKSVRSGSSSCHDVTIHSYMGICKALFLGHLSPSSVSNYPALAGGSNAPNPALHGEVCDTGEEMRRSVHFSFSLLVCLLLLVQLDSAQTQFEIRNSEELQGNPKGVKLSLRTRDGRSTLHLYETIPIDLEFRSSQPSSYSIELDEYMNFAGSSNTFEVSPTETAFVTFSVLSSPGAVCCDSMKHFLSPQPTILHRALSDYVRFEKPGLYSIFLLTNRVFRGLGKKNDFAPSKITLTSNILTLDILPDVRSGILNNSPSLFASCPTRASQQTTQPLSSALTDSALGPQAILLSQTGLIKRS